MEDNKIKKLINKLLNNNLEKNLKTQYYSSYSVRPTYTQMDIIDEVLIELGYEKIDNRNCSNCISTALNRVADFYFKNKDKLNKKEILNENGKDKKRTANSKKSATNKK